MNWLLIKFALIAAILMNPLNSNYLIECNESIPIQSEPELVVGNLSEDNITLYAIQKDGELKNFKLESNGTIQYFPTWFNVSNEAYYPKIFYKDINSDGNKELIIVLTTGYGTGNVEQNVHVFNKHKINIGEDYKEVFKEVLVDNPLAIILKNVKTTLTKSEANITIGDEETVIKIDKMGIPSNHLFQDVDTGNIIKFDVINNELTAIIGAQIAPAGGLIGNFYITYSLKDKMYQLKKIKFISNNNEKAPN